MDPIVADGRLYVPEQLPAHVHPRAGLIEAGA